MSARHAREGFPTRAPLRGVLGAAGAALVIYLAVALSGGRALYDWAWASGQHATPAQWNAHQRLGREGVTNHHGFAWSDADPAVAVGATVLARDASHGIQPPPGDQRLCAACTIPAPALDVRPVAHASGATRAWTGPAIIPPTQPPRPAPRS